MNRRYFGTDGVRGRVGAEPMTPDVVLKLGWAAGRVLASDAGAKVLIGKDTRRSGYMFESALEAGLAAAGVEVDLLGPLPTPAVAYLTRALRAQAGVVVSASHNLHQDNGVKFFSAEGGKLSDAVEARIERLMTEPMVCVPPEQTGHALRMDDASGRYIEYCKSTFRGRSLRGIRAVVDCANGAAYRVAPSVFSELGAEVIATGCQPNGFNINDRCGSTAMEALTVAVRERHAHVGIAFDGDADRCQMVDADGRVVDGDQIILIIARRRQELGLLRGPVVGTQMSNLGLEHAVTALGVEFQRAQVGDRHVLKLLEMGGGVVGGETSGHVLCLDIGPTGDGIITALQVLEAMQASGRALADLAADMHKLPQVLVNVPVEGMDARRLLEEPAMVAAVSRVEKELGGRGRVLLRPSGTEPVVRVMVEAPDAVETRRMAEQLASAVKALMPIAA
ncbi:MAG TPA: phosphoglucosamine mutase [Nevskiaceae bacterium]